MIYAITGSRIIENHNVVFDLLNKHKSKISLLITGGAVGVDTLAYIWATDNVIPVKIIRPKDKTNKYSYLERNKQIVDECDRLLYVWDGLSKGTNFTLNYARSQGKPIYGIIFQENQK